jgi:hypothetical protein
MHCSGNIIMVRDVRPASNRLDVQLKSPDDRVRPLSRKRSSFTLKGWHKVAILAMFLMLIASIPFFVENEVDMKTLEFRNQIAYLKDDYSPYSGKVIEYFPRNSSRAQKRVFQSGQFKNGLREGKWVINNWNGERELVAYHQGKRNGRSIWFYTGGRKKQLQEYKDDKPHGPGTYWDQAGEITKQVYYVYGAIRPYPKDVPTADIGALEGWWEKVSRNR